MNKGVTVEQNETAIRLTKQAGITCVADVMMGMPAETPETIEETVRFLQRTAPVLGPIPLLYPLPTTFVYDDAKERRACCTENGRPRAAGHGLNCRGPTPVTKHRKPSMKPHDAFICIRA